MTIGAWEWANLARYVGWQRYLYALTIALLLIAVSFLIEISSSWALAILLIAALWWVLALILVIDYPRSQRYWSSRWVLTLLGPIMLVPGYVGLMQLKQTNDSHFLILLLFFLIWGADIGAYFSGLRWGDKKLAPAVSPGKSWAGFYGGVTLATLIAIAMCLWLGKPVMLSAAGLVFVLGCILVILFSVLGDLTESMFKRQRGIKDSSQLLPGHGGVLDRVDSLLAGAPIFALFVLLFDWQ